MNIPMFSIFSAVSEILVTIIVLYTVAGNLRGGPLRWRLLGACLLFEVCVNVVYMVHRAGQVDAGPELSAMLSTLMMIHGILSLVMLMGLILIYLISTFDFKAGHPTWFQRHRAATWAFIFLWLLSVGSGEAVFVWRYFPIT